MGPFWSRRRVFHVAALVVVAVGLYGSNFDHDFHLDSRYGLLENPAIRSLDRIPSYFVDPFTLTSLRSNADYRPVLQTTYALNYALSGYGMWSWHLVQVLLHAFNAVCLMALVALLLPRLLNAPSAHIQEWVPWIVGALFLVHPTASGVVNYLWARSSLLAAAFVLSAILCFVRDRIGWATAFYCLALFTKVEAVGCLGAFTAWLVVRATERSSEEREARLEGPLAGLRALYANCAWKSLGLALLVTLAYVGLRFVLLPDFLVAARSDADVTSLAYFSTQLTAWWHYVGHWWVPIGLVADNASYSTYESLLDPPVLLALVAWIAVASSFVVFYRTRPVYSFLAISALALISPHSSFLPLAEMVNEHRPYLPLGLLSLCWLVPGTAFLLGHTNPSRRRRRYGLVTVAALIVALGVATHHRNAVFRTWDSYWEDIVRKAPSWRSHLNLGWSQAARGMDQSAEKHFQLALAYAPQNSYVLSNLGLLYGRQGNRSLALGYLEQAVALDRFTTISLEARADYFLTQQAYAEAVTDLELALEKTSRPLIVHQRLAQAHAGGGDWQASLRHTLAARELAEDSTALEIAAITRPFWASEEQCRLGLRYFAALAEEWPEQWWIHKSWGELALRLGEVRLGREQLLISERLRQK